MQRRSIIKSLAITAGALATGRSLIAETTKMQGAAPTLKGNIHHSVCRWCYNDLSVEEMCKAVKKIGIQAIDLVGPADWDTLKKHGIFSSMCNGAEINLTDGFASKTYHAQLISNYTAMIPKVAAAGYKNLICFSGSRRGMDNETGWQNCVDGIRPIIGLAEKHGVVLHMELLNSKIDHADYMCDRTWWGAELCKRIGSPNFKLLYDIYHMQIDEGDVIRNIRDHHAYIGHYHTAGVPGRHELDDNQELFYPAIMKAILATGFNDYVAHEFIPTGKDVASRLKALEQAVSVCDV